MTKKTQAYLAERCKKYSDAIGYVVQVRSSYFVDTPVALSAQPGVTLLRTYTSSDFSNPSHPKIGWHEYQVKTMLAFKNIRQEINLALERRFA
jgi:hypothetical protein